MKSFQFSYFNLLAELKQHWRLSGIPWELNLNILLLNFD